MTYSTDNTPLAITLATLGVPWADPQNPDWLCYTPQLLEKGGCKTAEEAQRKGVPGNRRYFFADHPDREKIVREFEKAWTGKAGSEELPDIDAALLAKFAALTMKNRRTFLAAQKLTPAKMMFRRADGSYAIVGKSAKAEDLERLGLK